MIAAAIRVLYVDDESDLLGIGKMFLEESGDFNVTTALSAQEGIRLLEQEKFDAIISDYQMPGMNGIQFLVEVRSRFGPIPFILFTGRGREEVVIQAINSGVDFYLQKGGEPGAQFAELSHKVKVAASGKRAEDSLAESERVHATMISNLPGFVYRCANDRDWTMEYLSDGCREITGYAPDELLNNKTRTYNDLVHKEFQKSLWDKVQNFLEKKEVIEIEYPIITKTGETRWVWERGRGIYSEDGRLLYLEGFITDITERKVAEEAVRASHDQLTKSEADLRIHQIELEIQAEELRKSKLALEVSRDKFLDLFDFAPLGYLTLNDKALIIEVNLNGATLLGVERSKLINARFRKFIAQADLDVWDRYFMHVLNRGEKQISTLTLKRNDGTLFPARLESIRIIHSDGTPTVRVAVSDITDIKLVEDTLRESEEKFRATIGQSMDGILITDGAFNIIEWNAAQTQIYGNTREEMLGKPLWEFQFATMTKEQKSPGLLEKMKQRMLDHSASPDSVWMNSLHDYTVQCGDGPCKTVQISTFPIVFRNSILFGAISRDITERKRLEEALITSQALLNTTIDSIPDIIGIQKTDHTIVRYNRAGYEFLHLTPEEVHGRRCYELIGRTIPCDDCATGKALKSKKTEQSERYLPEYGIHLDCRSTPVLDKAGEIVFIVEQMRDITERRRAEAAITESFAIFQNVMDSLDALVYVSDMNTHEILFINQYGKEIFGEVTGKICWKSIQVDQAGPCPFCTNEKLLDSDGNPTGILIWEFQNTINGHWYECHDSAIRWTDGRIVRIEIASDITERKVAESAFRQLSADHTVIIDNTPAMVWYKDTKNNFIRVNPAGAQAFGLSIEEIEGKSTYDLFPDFAEKYYQNDLDVIHSGEPRLCIIEPMTTASGEHRWVQTDKIPLRDEQGTITGILVFSVDITERKRAEEALRQANKKLNLLSSITRHDINNQLTLLMGFLTILKKKQPDPAFDEYFVKVSTAAQRISSMIQFTREYENIGVHAPVWQDCRTLVDTAAKQVTLGKVMMKNDLPASAEVFADPLIVKVCYNLMDNAVRYGGKITTIRFSVQESGEDRTIVCEDDGDGVVAEEKEKIFERGFGKNTGLGLALSREILSITGITIRETGEPGKGARFEMTVPKGAWK